MYQYYNICIYIYIFIIIYQSKYRYLIQLVISFAGFTYWLKVLERISHTNPPLAIWTSPCSRALFIIVRLSKRSKSIISMLQFVWMLLIRCWYEPFAGDESVRALAAAPNAEMFILRRPVLLKGLAKRCFPGTWTFDQLQQRGVLGVLAKAVDSFWPENPKTTVEIQLQLLFLIFKANNMRRKQGFLFI